MRTRSILAALVLTAAPLFAQTGMEQMMQHFGGNSNVKVEDDDGLFVPNSFVGRFTMEMQSWENGKPGSDKPMVVNMSNSADKSLMAFSTDEGMNMKMLTDLKGKWTYLLIDNPEGGKMAMKSHKKKVTYTGKEAEAKDDWKVTLTQETKTIDGHVCTKVIGTGEEGTWTAWVAKDLKIDFGNVMGTMGTREDEPIWKEVNGFPLEMEMKDEKGQTMMQMHMKDIRNGPVDDAVFSLEGYQVMEMPSMGK